MSTALNEKYVKLFWIREAVIKETQITLNLTSQLQPFIMIKMRMAITTSNHVIDTVRAITIMISINHSKMCGLLMHTVVLLES